MPSRSRRSVSRFSAENLGWTATAAATVATCILMLLVADEWIRDALLHALSIRTSRLALATVGALLVLAIVLDVVTSRARRPHAVLARPFRTAREIHSPLAAVPTFVWLTAIVVLSAGVRVALATVNSVPTVFADELVYSGLAKGVAFHGIPLLRGELELGYSIGYPMFASVAWLIAPDATSAFGVVKVMNAVAMATTAIPAYLLAHRIVTRPWALGVAAMSAVAPWTVYAAFVMTESLFYPAFTVFALLVVRMLEHSTRRRQFVVLAGLVGLVAVRPQAAVLAASLIAAIAIVGVRTGSIRDALRRNALVLGGLSFLSVGYVILGVAGLQRPGEAYLAVFDDGFGVVALGEWAVRNLAAYELGLGVIAFVAFPVALHGLLGRSATESERAVGATAITLAGGILVSVVVLSATPYGLERLHERNLFYVTPLVLTCFAHWLTSGLRRPRRLTVVVALGAALLPAALSTELLRRTPAVDSLLTSAFRDPGGEISVDSRAWAVGLGVAGVVAFLVAQRALVPVLSIAVAFGLLTAENVYPGAYVSPLSREQTRALGWIDRALPDGQEAEIVYVSCDPATRPCRVAPDNGQERLVTWTEFFNRRVERVVRLGPATSGGMDAPRLTVAQDGLLLEDGEPLAARYIVLDSRWPVVGEPVARIESPKLASHPQDMASLTLWRAELPVRLAN